MENIANKINSLQEYLINKINYQKISQNELKQLGLNDVELRDYQMDGINWLIEKKMANIGCILADEMGLGKTIQTISFLLYLYGSIKEKRPSLVIAPLSVVDNWKNELSRFASDLIFFCYLGNKDERNDLMSKIKLSEKSNIIISTYEICLKDEYFLSTFNWSVLVVDEAHRLKNNKSLLHITLKNFNIEFRLLLTGTPIQNNLSELYSLLSFCNKNIFHEEDIDEFIKNYQQNDVDNLNDLSNMIDTFILRRLKCDVIKDLPTKSEIILYHGLSLLQKKFYKAILLKDFDAFKSGSKTRLLNVLSQLRKCVCHPYLFDGVEPEPFEIGEHLIESSCKLHVLDKLLKFLKKNHHRVLIFSQMTRHLDIIQDYLTYRDYTYERLDGSVRAEERNFSVKRFNDEKSDVFTFLLSTRAGGQGLNLTTADTVIILDSDFNPQNDLQAAARAHRIGQKKNVKVIRLVCSDTVEEIIIKRAQSKLKLSNQVIDSKNPNNNEDNSVFMLNNILKFGLDKILSNNDTNDNDKIDFEKILGKTIDGEWINEDNILECSQELNAETATEQIIDNMYMFEGQDYSKSNSNQLDEEALAKLLEDNIVSGEFGEENGLFVRNHLIGKSKVKIKSKKKILTEEELLERKKKQLERKEAIAKLSEEIELKRAEDKQVKRLAKWKNNNYTSCLINDEYDPNVTNINFNDEDENYSSDENNEETHFDEDDSMKINYLIGDVMHPVKSQYNKNIILHCVDNSGVWGSGGVFRSIDLKSKIPSNQYMLAAQMQDLKIGDVHLIEIKPRNYEFENETTDYLALLVVQCRNRKNILSLINIPIFENTLKIVSQFALKNKASVHLPRIGERSPGGSWYATERLVRKHLTTKHIPTYIYYYPRNPLKRKENYMNINQYIEDKSKDVKKFKLPDFLDQKHLTFKGIFSEDLSYIKRQIIAYGGDYDESISSLTTHLVLPDDAIVHEDGNFKLISFNELKHCIQKQFLE